MFQCLYVQSWSLGGEALAPLVWLFAKQIASNLSPARPLLHADAKRFGQAWSQTIQSHMRESFPIYRTHASDTEEKALGAQIPESTSTPAAPREGNDAVNWGEVEISFIIK